MLGRHEAYSRRVRLRRCIRRTRILFVTLVLTSCTSCDHKDHEGPNKVQGDSQAVEPTPAPPWPPAASLVVVPGEVYSAAGASFSLALRAFDSSKVPTAPPSPITWSAVPSGVKVTGSGETAVVDIPSNFSGTTFRVFASAGGLKSSPATVKLSSGLKGDRVKLQPTPGVPPMAVVVDAGDMGDGKCKQDMRWNVTGVAVLGRNLYRDTCAAPEEVAVFSTDHGMLFATDAASSTTGAGTGEAAMTNAAKALGVVPPWTSSEDVLTRAALPAMQDVPVALRIRVDDTLASQTMTAAFQEISLASAIFAAGRTGIQFSVSSTDSAGPVSFDVGDCSNLTALAKLGVDLAKDSLYVAYVQEITPNDPKGLTCERMPSDHGVLAVVSASAKAPTTAAHELGHVMGLNAPLPLYGHSGWPNFPLWGFDYTNLMWVGETITRPLPRSGITLGQAFRMNLDSHSWLVHIHPPPAGGIRQCQCDVYKTGVCPVMSLSVMDLAPRPSTYPDPTCTTDPWNP